MKSGSIPKDTVSAEMNRQLPKIILGENFECIYEPILYFGNDSTIKHFKKRAEKPQQYDRPGYANDILILLVMRTKQFKLKKEFMQIIKSFKKPTSIEYFLEMHLQKLPFQSRLEVMAYIIKKRKLPGYHAYVIPAIMQNLYKENPVGYDTFIKPLSNDPDDEYSCFKNETCP